VADPAELARANEEIAQAHAKAALKTLLFRVTNYQSLPPFCSGIIPSRKTPDSVTIRIGPIRKRMIEIGCSKPAGILTMAAKELIPNTNHQIGLETFMSPPQVRIGSRYVCRRMKLITTGAAGPSSGQKSGFLSVSCGVCDGSRPPSFQLPKRLSLASLLISGER
jgi:hypothetical protein